MAFGMTETSDGWRLDLSTVFSLLDGWKWMDG